MKNEILTILKDKGIKQTQQRLNILSIIDENGHINIDMINTKIKSISPTISLGTIYKNIEFLKEKKIIKEIFTKENKPMYEIEKEEHFHIVKNKKVEDVIYTKEQIEKIKKILNLNDNSKIDLTVYIK